MPGNIAIRAGFDAGNQEDAEGNRRRGGKQRLPVMDLLFTNGKLDDGGPAGPADRFALLRPQGGSGKGAIEEMADPAQFVCGRLQRRIGGNRAGHLRGIVGRKFAEHPSTQAGIIGMEIHGSRSSEGRSSRRRLRPAWMRKPTFPLLRPVASQIS